MKNLEAHFTSDQGQDYTIRVTDRENGTGFEEMKCGSDGFKLRTNGTNNDPTQRILTTSATVELNGSLSIIETFALNLVSSDEFRFVLTIRRGLNNNGLLVFAGRILPDTVKIKNEFTPVRINIEAVDGLSLLKDYKYKPENFEYYTGFETWLGVIYECLEKIKVNDLYDSSDIYFISGVEVYEDNHEDETVDPLSVIRNNQESFIKERGGGNNYKLFDCYKVLELILVALNARLIYSGGSYCVEQYKTRMDASFRRILYDKNKNPQTITNNLDVSIDQSNYAVMNGSNFEFLPPLRRAEILYEYEARENFLYGYEFIDSIVCTKKNLGAISIEPGDEVVAKLDFKLTYKYDLPVGVDPNVIKPTLPFRQFVFRVIVQVGSQYLSGDIEISSQTSEWVSTSDSLEHRTGDARLPVGYFDVGMETDPIPGNGGDVKVAICYLGFYDANNNFTQNFPPEFTLKYTVKSPSLKFYVKGDNSEKVLTASTYLKENNTDNSKQKEEKTVIGDGPTKYALNAIEVYKNSSDEWLKSSKWHYKGSSKEDKLLRLSVNAVARMQSKPLRVLSGTIFDRTAGIFPVSRIVYDGGYFLAMQTEFNANMNEVRGSWIQIKDIDVDDSSGVTEASGFEYDEAEIGSDDGSNLPPHLPPGVIRVDQEIAQNTPTTQVPVINTQYSVFSQGDKLLLIDPETNQVDEVTVAETFEPGDNFIKIDSKTFPANVAVDSYVKLDPTYQNSTEYVQNNFQNARKYDDFGGTVNSGSSVTLTEFQLPNITGWSDREINKRIDVIRNGRTQFYPAGFTVNGQTINFSYDLNNEYVQVYFL